MHTLLVIYTGEPSDQLLATASADGSRARVSFRSRSDDTVPPTLDASKKAYENLSGE